MVVFTFCTVCGVKLTPKNRISYRPNSCRDCELERKRLYSLKRKEDNKKRTKSSGKVAAKTSKLSKSKVKSKPVVKKSLKAAKPKLKSKEQIKREKERERLRLQKERERERLLKERERENLRREKERERLRLQKEREKDRLLKERERERLRREKEKEQLKKEKEKEKLNKEKEKEQLKVLKEREREEKRRDKEKEKEQKRLEKEADKERKRHEKEEIKRKAEEERKEKARRKKLLEMNIITDVPDYALNATSFKVKPRRFGNKAQKKSQIVEAQDVAVVTEGSVAKHSPFNPQTDQGEVFRAPSDTPWEGSNFKIVDGVFVAHTDNDAEESRGPSEDEVKAIIERIRLEHKNRKEAAE